WARHSAVDRYLPKRKRVDQGRGADAAADQRRSDEPRSEASAGILLPPLRRGRKSPGGLQVAGGSRSEGHSIAVLSGRGPERSGAISGGRQNLSGAVDEDSRRPRCAGELRPEPGRPAQV